MMKNESVLPVMDDGLNDQSGQFQITFRLSEVEPKAQFAEASPGAHLYFSFPCATRKKRAKARERSDRLRLTNCYAPLSID